MNIARYHLPGLFEFYDLYKKFLPLYRTHREYFYEWCSIESIYGAPGDCIWGGGRVGFGDADPVEVISLLKEYDISPRLTFSNSLLIEENLQDKKCNHICSLFSACRKLRTGIIIHSDLLLNYLRKRFPDFYYISSTTKVLTDFHQFHEELKRDEFEYVVPDFRLNKDFADLEKLSREEKNKVEFLCNECCFVGCTERKACYENVSRKSLGQICPDHVCRSPGADRGYVFSKAMKNPSFIGIEEIQKLYLQAGFTNFKIEGRSLGSAIVLEFLLYYLTKPEYQLNVREAIYLDSSLDLF